MVQPASHRSTERLLYRWMDGVWKRWRSPREAEREEAFNYYCWLVVVECGLDEGLCNVMDNYFMVWIELPQNCITLVMMR